MAKIIREKTHRLSPETYRGLTIVSITACIKDKMSFFTTRQRFVTFEGILHDELKRYDCGADVYLFMPDHAHLMLRGESETADVLRAMRSFKQKTGFWLSQNHSSIRWQKDFYDHIIRDDKGIEKHIQYILQNSVRKGLVTNWKDYPFKGSTIHNLDEWDFI